MPIHAHAAHRHLRQLHRGLQHRDDAGLADALPRQAQHEGVELRAASAPACPRHPWARRTCPGSGAARPATRRCRRARAPSSGWPAGWRTGTRGAGAPSQRRGPRGPAPLRCPSACPADRRPATRLRPGSPQQLAHPGRAVGSRRGRPGDRHASLRLGAVPCGCPPAPRKSAQAMHTGTNEATRQGRSACEAAPLVHDVGVDAVRHRHARHRRSGLRAFAQNLRLEFGAVTPPRDLLGVFHGVHLNSLVDTILAA